MVSGESQIRPPPGQVVAPRACSGRASPTRRSGQLSTTSARFALAWRPRSQRPHTQTGIDRPAANPGDGREAALASASLAAPATPRCCPPLAPGWPQNRPTTPTPCPYMGDRCSIVGAGSMKRRLRPVATAARARRPAVNPVREPAYQGSGPERPGSPRSGGKPHTGRPGTTRPCPAAADLVNRQNGTGGPGLVKSRAEHGSITALRSQETAAPRTAPPPAGPPAPTLWRWPRDLDPRTDRLPGVKPVIWRT